MTHTLEVLFSPAEFQALLCRDLRETVCVVFDVLRATSTMMTALANGAVRIIPVAEIPEALALRKADPEILLAGERDGVRILANQTGGIDFDLGNSPREFTRDQVQGKTIVMTTTNGTRALRACLPAQAVLLGSFLGMAALAEFLRNTAPANLLLVCAGTHEEAAYEDTLAAGCLAQEIWPLYEKGRIADSAAIARDIYRLGADNLREAIKSARNGRRLLANPELSADAALCLQRDRIDFLAEMCVDGVVRRKP